jgi:carbohydrate-selective porin OprB
MALEVGVNNSGSNGYARFNQFWWQQSMFDHRLVLQVGKIDQKTHFNANLVASSDGREFLMQSMVHSQTIAFPVTVVASTAQDWVNSATQLGRDQRARQWGPRRQRVAHLQQPVAS